MKAIGVDFLGGGNCLGLEGVTQQREVEIQGHA